MHTFGFYFSGLQYYVFIFPAYSITFLFFRPTVLRLYYSGQQYKVFIFPAYSIKVSFFYELFSSADRKRQILDEKLIENRAERKENERELNREDENEKERVCERKEII